MALCNRSWTQITSSHPPDSASRSPFPLQMGVNFLICAELKITATKRLQKVRLHVCLNANTASLSGLTRLLAAHLMLDFDLTLLGFSPPPSVWNNKRSTLCLHLEIQVAIEEEITSYKNIVFKYSSGDKMFLGPLLPHLNQIIIRHREGFISYFHHFVGIFFHGYVVILTDVI